jgi:hypothetical protein
MRTTIRMNDDLLREAKQAALDSNRSLTAFLEDAVREVLARRRQRRERPPILLPTFRGTGLRPGVNLDNSAELLDLMEEGLTLDQRR